MKKAALVPFAFLLVVLGSHPESAHAKCSNRLEKLYSERLATYLEVDKRINATPARRPGALDFIETCHQKVTDLFDSVFGSLNQVAPEIFERHEIECIRTAQIDFGPKRYVSCTSRSDSILDSDGKIDVADPPCMENTPTYSSLNTYLFKKAAACTGMAPAELFRLFSHESGFHPEMVSGTKCAGIGQMSVARITELYDRDDQVKNLGPKTSPVTRAILESIRDFHANIEKDPSCHAFKNVVNYRGNPEYRCQFLYHSWRPDKSGPEVPLNPEVGYFMAAKAYMINRAQIQATMKIWAKSYKFIDKLEAGQRDRLLAGLTTIAHNSGMAGLVSQFTLFMKTPELTRFLRKKYASQELVKADDLLNDFSDYMAVNYPVESRDPKEVKARRKEVSGYYANARASTIDIELKTGARCFR